MDDRGAFPIGSFHSGLATAQPKPPRSSIGRRSTATLPTATGGTATAIATETANGKTADGDTATKTARKRKERSQPRTAWELRETILPPLSRHRRRNGKGKAPAPRAWYAALVEYVHLMRYATADQLQRRFPQWLTSPRTARRHLANLTDAGHLATESVRSTSPYFPLVYFATRKGTRLVEAAYAERGIEWESGGVEQRRTRGRSLDSLLHEVLVTEFLLSIELAIAARDDLKLLKRERRYFRRDRRLTYRSPRGTRHLEPDAGFLAAVERPDGTRNPLPMHFVELDNGTMPLRRLREKFAAYQQWASTEGEDYLRDETAGYGVTGTPNFRLLVIAHDKYDSAGDHRRLAKISEAVMELPRTMRDRIWLTPATSLGRNKKETADLDRPLWYRGRDLARLIAETPDRTTADLLSAPTAPIPRHAIFPHDCTAGT